GYRHSRFKTSGEVVLRARLALRPGDKQAGMKKLLEQIQYRTSTQPKGGASIGCIFKNFELRLQTTDYRLQTIPDEFVKKGKIPAGWLVEKAGLKGTQIAGAMISPVHGNFIVNEGKAAAADVLALIALAKEKVYDTFGIELEEEIQIF
ncbi:MAG: hypothetical protein AAB932_02490, partial [Patescibacteria group bacterium]